VDRPEVLGALNLQELVYVSAGYATAQHLHDSLMAAIGDEISRRMVQRATEVRGGWESIVGMQREEL
jgi:hypothetical protein